MLSHHCFNHHQEHLPQYNKHKCRSVAEETTCWQPFQAHRIKLGVKWLLPFNHPAALAPHLAPRVCWWCCMGTEREKCSVQCQQCMHASFVVADILPWSLQRKRLVSSSDAAALCNDTLWQSSQTTIDCLVQHIWHARGLKWGFLAAPREDFIPSLMSLISFFSSSSLLLLCPWWLRRFGNSVGCKCQ